MAKGRSYRVASKAIYRNSDVAQNLRPEVREKLAGEAFELSDALRYPSATVRAELGGLPRYPTRAKYWTQHSEKRLRSARPLKGEGKKGAAKRATLARSFFAAESERKRTTTTKRQWRIVLFGTVERTDPDGDVMTFTGSQHGPWRDVPTGGLTNPLIKESYREVARYSVSVDARGRPEFGHLHSSGFAEYRARGKSQDAILYIEHAEIETRDVAPDTDNEA